MDNSLDNHVGAYQGSNLYDFDNSILLNWYAKRIVELTGASGTMLELGLGHGFTTQVFAEHFSRYVVLEGSDAVVENYRTRYPDCTCEIVTTYFEEFETDERFDHIVLGFILEHVDDPVEILSRYRRFVKPGGSVFASVPNAEVLNRRLGHLAGMLPDITELSENDHLLGHQRYYTVETFSEDIEKAGYEIESMEGIYLKPMTTSQLVSLNLDPKIIDALCQIGIQYPELCCGILAHLK